MGGAALSSVVGLLLLADTMRRMLRNLYIVWPIAWMVLFGWSLFSLFQMELFLLLHLLHLNHPPIVIIIFVLVKGKLDGSFLTSLVLRAWSPLPLHLHLLLLFSSSRVEVINSSSLHEMLLHLKANLCIIDRCLLLDDFLLLFKLLFSCIRVHVSLKEVAVQLPKAFTQEHISDWFTLLIYDLLNPIILAIIITQWFKVWLRSSAVINLVLLSIDFLEDCVQDPLFMIEVGISSVYAWAVLVHVVILIVLIWII